MAASGLCCFAQAFSRCGEQGLLFVVLLWLLIVVASLVVECKLWGAQASVAVACGLTCSMAGRFLSAAPPEKSLNNGHSDWS